MPKKTPYTVVTAIFHGNQEPVELKAYSRTGAINDVTRLAKTYANTKALFFDDDRGRNLFTFEDSSYLCRFVYAGRQMKLPHKASV